MLIKTLKGIEPLSLGLESKMLPLHYKVIVLLHVFCFQESNTGLKLCLVPVHGFAPWIMNSFEAVRFLF